MDAVLPDAQAVLTVDLDALASNWRLCAARAGAAECGAVVKADAYGTGIATTVPALARAGCRTFFTAHAAEGARARQALRAEGFADEGLRVFVLNGFLPEAAPLALFARFGLSPVLDSAEQVARFAAERASAGGLRSALHVDTGMNRTGLDPEDAAALAPDALVAAGVDLLMSHFVEAEEPNSATTAAQLAAFDALRRLPALSTLPASLANSSGHFLDPVPAYALTRPGYALYGGNPCPGAPNPMRPVVRLDARVLQLRTIEAGERVGYGGRWTARRRTRLATIGVGYADGLLRQARSLGEGDGPVALLRGTPCPLIGRVSMDLSLVDVTDAPGAAAGDLLTLLGNGLGVDDLGAACGTIGYEVLTSLGRRYARRTVGA